MEVIRGRERDCRQEIRGQARRGGTRSTQRVDSQRQAFRPAADEGETYRMRAKAGATAGSPRRWTPASPLSSGPVASWSRKGSRRRWPANSTRTPPGGGFSPARRKVNCVGLGFFEIRKACTAGTGQVDGI